MRLPLHLIAAMSLALAGSAQAAPERVVSMNLCTDQLAMMLAAPGQLLSISRLARDPRSSAMADEALAYQANDGEAEEIFLLDPELVIAGQFTARASVNMLRRLGISVVTMAPAYSLDDVRDRITEMGALLGREDAAANMLAEFDAGLAALQDPVADQPRAVIYDARGYTSGTESLAGAILTAAGFTNLAEEAGLRQDGLLPLEQLVMLSPDLIVLPTRWPGASRAEELLEHPALRAVQAHAGTAPLTDSDWACGTPHVLRAIERLADARRHLAEAP